MFHTEIKNIVVNVSNNKCKKESSRFTSLPHVLDCFYSSFQVDRVHLNFETISKAVKLSEQFDFNFKLCKTEIPKWIWVL
jgi:hypothetical protein